MILIKMETKTNISAIELYSRKALKPILEKHFNVSSLSGRQILNFCDLAQLNYFTLYLLFDKWKEETSKLESPYFDFSQEEVKSALQSFMDTLSQHILVKREDFAPLLLQSIFNTLFFALSPLPFLEQKFIAIDKKYSETELMNLVKYLKIHPRLLEYIKANMQNFEGKQGKEIIQYIKEGFEMTNTEEVEATKALLFFDPFLAVQLSDFHYQETSVTTTADEPKKTNGHEYVPKAPKNTTLHLHTKNKILDIRAAMNINQRFMFIKELFKGNEQVFQQAMEEANGSENYEAAVNTLIDTYAQKNNWEIDSEQVNELFDLIGRRFYPASFKD